MAQAGDNASQVELVDFVERIENLNEQIKDIQDDRKDVFTIAKSKGYDPRTIREVIRIRKIEPQVRQEQQALLDTYLAAFGIE